MQIKGSPPPRPQTPVSTSGPAGTEQAKNTAGAAGADKTKSAAGAAGTQASAASDSYLPARPQGGQTPSFVGQKINVGDVNAGRMGCCCPEPPTLGPIGMTPAQFAKLQASIAKSSYDETTRKAGSDGKIDDREQRDVNSKGREWKKAEGRADVETAKEAHQAARKEAMKDGRISPAEEMRLAVAEMKIWGMEQKLKGLEAQDKRMDEQDKRWNNIDGPLEPKILRKDLNPELFVDGPAPIDPWSHGKFKEIPFPKLPDFPILPYLDPRPIFAVER